MKFLAMKSAAFAIAVSKAVDAHTVFTNFYVDGANQGPGTCVRMNKSVPNATFFVPTVTSDDMACGIDGSIGVERVCPANAGSTLTFEFHDRPDVITSGAIDPSHKGTCAVYMKKVDSAVANDTAKGDGWFKIYAADYNTATSTWCTEDLIANNGLLSVKIPSDIAGGYYLVRPELLALHQADKTPPIPQFYTGCAQVFLQSTGTAVPVNTVSIPGYVNMSNPAMSFNIWKTPMALPYPMFGPPAYVSSASKRGLEVRATQTEGLKPAGCVLEMGNWCGMELASYSTSDGCWNASKICWNEATDCYSSAGATGDANCKIWEDKCTTIDNDCNAGNFNGPPNAGQDLTPAVESPSVPAPAVETLSTSGAQATGASVVSYSTTASVTAVAYMASTSTAAAASASTSAAQSSSTADPLLNTVAPDVNPLSETALPAISCVEVTHMRARTRTKCFTSGPIAQVGECWSGGVSWPSRIQFLLPF